MDADDAPLAALLHVLAATPAPAAVSRAIARGALRRHVVDIVMVHRRTDAALDLQCHHGLTAPQARLAQRLDLAAALPHCSVISAGTELVLSAHEVATRFPLMHGLELPARGMHLVLPILREARPMGTLSVHMAGSPADALGMHPMLVAVADALALWLPLEDPPASAVTSPLRVTARQRRVLDALRQGQTNAAIASDLGFAIGTIKADITHLSAILGAHGRAELVRKAAQAGL